MLTMLTTCYIGEWLGISPKKCPYESNLVNRIKSDYFPNH
jgi:hypothetical protein